MTSDPGRQFQRLKTIERGIAILRILIAVFPLWIAGDILIWLSPNNMWGYGLTVLGLIAILLILGVLRLIMTSCFVGPDHRFFNDARRVASFIDRARARGYVRVYGPSELLKLKAINLVVEPLGWGILLAAMFGGYIYIMDAFSAGQPWPVYAGVFFEWGMPALFLIFVFLAISQGVSTIRSDDVTDFPLTRAILSPKTLRD